MKLLQSPFKPVLVGVVLVAAVCGTSVAGGEPGSDPYGGYLGPNRDNIYPGTGLLAHWPATGPKLLWKYDQLGDGWTSVSVAGGAVYTLGGTPGNLFAFTLDGELKYKAPYGREFQKRFNGSRSTPEIRGGAVYFASGVGVVYCLDAATGAKRWEVDTVAAFSNKVSGWGYNITPLMVDDKVICPIRRGTATMVALDAATGKTVWSSPASTYGIGDSSPVLVQRGPTRLVFCNLWNATVAIDPGNGDIVWKYEGPSGTTVTSPVIGDRVFATRGNGTALYRLAKDGKGFDLVWEGEGIHGLNQAVALDGKIFVLAKENRSIERVEVKGGKEQKRTVTQSMFCIQARDLATGKRLHSEPVTKDGSMSAADGMIYLLEGGEGAWQAGQPAKTQLSLIKPTPTGFEIVSRFDPLVGTKEAWLNPCIAAGRLFLRHGSLLACYDLRPASYRSDSPAGNTERK